MLLTWWYSSQNNTNIIYGDGWERVPCFRHCTYYPTWILSVIKITQVVVINIIPILQVRKLSSEKFASLRKANLLMVDSATFLALLHLRAGVVNKTFNNWCGVDTKPSARVPGQEVETVSKLWNPLGDAGWLGWPNQEWDKERDSAFFCFVLFLFCFCSTRVWT
jgi:hypothetical protein